MDRAAIGLGSVFMRLKAELNWAEMFQNLTNDFNLDSLKKQQREALLSVGLEKEN